MDKRPLALFYTRGEIDRTGVEVDPEGDEAGYDEEQEPNPVENEDVRIELVYVAALIGEHDPIHRAVVLAADAIAGKSPPTEPLPVDVHGNAETLDAFVNGRPVEFRTSDVRLGIEELEDLSRLWNDGQAIRSLVE